MAISWTKENASEESINAWTHGVGFLISIPCGVVLIQLAAEHQKRLLYACLIYSLSLTGLYLFSTLSHAVRYPKWRGRFRAWDQGLVYILIAGTFTPFIWCYMNGWSRFALLLFVWIAAVTGLCSKVLIKHRIDNITTVHCILLGWLPAMVLFGRVSSLCFATMAIGGVLYTIGTLFLMNDHRHRYFHAVWHLLVMLASACHYAAIAMFVILQVDGQV
jgi:hemolysin III